MTAEPGTTSSPRLTLFVTILSLFLTVALLVAAAVTIANFVQSRQIATKVASDTFGATIERINEKRVAFFAPVFLITELLRNDPAFREAAGSKVTVLELVMSALTLNPQISSVYVGHANGNFLQVLSISESEKAFVAELGGPPLTRFAIQNISADDKGVRIQTWRFLDENHSQISALSGRPAAYDPRARDWYRDAIANPQSVIRTPPYVFAATSQVGLTIAQAFGGGVVGTDITLDRLMMYVQSVRPNDKHRFVSFDEHHRLLAHFNPDRIVRRSGSGAGQFVGFGTTSDLIDPVAIEAMKVFARKGPYRSETFEVSGEEYIATVVRQVGQDKVPFFVLYAAPLSEYRESLTTAAWRSIPVTLLVFALTVPAIIFFARSISKPLARLSREAQSIRAFQLDDPVKMDSPVSEINTLIRSMSGMKATLREVTKFVPKALVKNILETEDVVAVGGDTRRISILFTDVKDFTEISQGIPAEALMVKLSEYFEELASLIIKENGTVDKFIGDAIFAFWNAPLPVERHEHQACATALKCSMASRRLNERWITQGRAPWHTRLGVHVGEAVLGNVGSSDRIDYTAIGDTVNIASRLEGLNKYYGTHILTSGEIADACSDEFVFRRVDRSRPKGSGTPLDIFELLGTHDGLDEFRIKPETAQLIQDWNNFYTVYASQDWPRARDTLEAFAAAYPEDAVAGIYRERIGEFLRSPPPRSWDGIMRFDEK